MLVRITREPSEDSVDGISLSTFKVGLVYSLPVPLATLMISEGWAVPASESESNAVTLPEIKLQTFPWRERRRRILSDRRLRLELGIAADRRRKRKR
jgi:hypothetical protein